MDKYKRISILLFIIVVFLSSKLILINKELKDIKEKSISEKIEIPKENRNNTSSDKNSNTEENKNENSDIKITDATSNINGIDENDNKLIRDITIKFLKSYSNYYDKEDTFEKRIQHRVYDIKDLMSDELFENIKLAVEGESRDLGDEYVFKKLNGINIYEANVSEDKVYINIGTLSTYYDFNMQLSKIHEDKRYATTDYKFTLAKINDKWIIENVQETFK